MLGAPRSMGDILVLKRPSQVMPPPFSSLAAFPLCTPSFVFSLVTQLPLSSPASAAEFPPAS